MRRSSSWSKAARFASSASRSRALTTDGRELLLTRYTEPEPELALLLDKLKFTLPEQPKPKITTEHRCSADLCRSVYEKQPLCPSMTPPIGEVRLGTQAGENDSMTY
jgi:hypothetical protein